MEQKIKILVVEDEMIIAAKISMLLTELGYEVTGIIPRGEEVFQHMEDNKPDIVLLDINLKGRLDGIETAAQLQHHKDLPIIFLTANSDEATFNRAKATRPYAFITKPFKQLDLQRAIELAISHLANHEQPIVEKGAEEMERPYILSDRLFIKYRDRMVKIMVADIHYVEAERNYCRIYTANKEFLLAVTLKTIEEKLPVQLFLRTHRSYVVNITHINEVGDGHVTIEQKVIPLSTGMKDLLLQRIQTL